MIVLLGAGKPAISPLSVKPLVSSEPTQFEYELQEHREETSASLDKKQFIRVREAGTPPPRSSPPPHPPDPDESRRRLLIEKEETDSWCQNLRKNTAACMAEMEAFRAEMRNEFQQLKLVFNTNLHLLDCVSPTIHEPKTQSSLATIPPIQPPHTQSTLVTLLRTHSPTSQSLLTAAQPIHEHQSPIVHSHLWKARCKQVSLKSTAPTGGVKKPHPLRLRTVAACGKYLKQKPQFQCFISAASGNVSGTDTNLSFVNIGCDAIDFVFGDKFTSMYVTCDNEKRKSFHKVRMQNRDETEFSLFESVGVRQDNEEPVSYEQGKGFCALHLFDKSPKSNGLCSATPSQDKELSDGFDGSENDVKQPVLCGSFQPDVHDLEASLESDVCSNNSSLISEDIDSKKAVKIINENIMSCTRPPDDCQLDDHKYEQPSLVTEEKELFVKVEMVLELIREKWKSRTTAGTQCHANIVQWLILCLRRCHCKMRENLLFSKEAFDGMSEMTQTSLSQCLIAVEDTLNRRDTSDKMGGDLELLMLVLFSGVMSLIISNPSHELVKGDQQLPFFLPYVMVFVTGESFTSMELLQHEYQIDPLQVKTIITIIQLYLNKCAEVCKESNMVTGSGFEFEKLWKRRTYYSLSLADNISLTSLLQRQHTMELIVGYLTSVSKFTSFGDKEVRVSQCMEALRSTTDDEFCDCGAGPHLLVKVIDKMLYELAELGPYVHDILVVVITLFINEDYCARFVGKEIISKLGITSAIIFSIFLEHLNSVAIAGIMENKQDVGNYLMTWIFIYWKFTHNGNHYKRHRDFQCHFYDYLSKLVETVLSNLESSKCVSKEGDIDLLPLNSDIRASYNFTSGSKTCELMLGGLSTILEDGIFCYYDGIMIRLPKHLSTNQVNWSVKPLILPCLVDLHLTIVLCLGEVEAGHKSKEYLLFEATDYPAIPELIYIFLVLESTLCVITCSILIAADIALGATIHGHMLHDKVLGCSTSAGDSLDGLPYDLGDNFLAGHNIDSTILGILNTSATELEISMASQLANVVDGTLATSLGSFLILGTLLSCTIELLSRVSHVGRSWHCFGRNFQA